MSPNRQRTYPFNVPLACLRLCALGISTFILVGISLICKFFIGKFPSFTIMAWHNIAVKICGLNIIKQGDIANQAPILFIANHISYLDIIILGALIKNFKFVAKSEVGGWGFIGWLAKQASTIFVIRKKAIVHIQSDLISQALQAKNRVLLFAEGTSTKGIKINPLKPSMLEPALSSDCLIQPVVIKYRKIDNLPIQTHFLPWVAWYGDMDLEPHIWQFLQCGQWQVVVSFLPLVNAKDFADRKALAHFLQQEMNGNFYGLN